MNDSLIAFIVLTGYNGIDYITYQVYDYLYQLSGEINWYRWHN